MKKRIVSIFLVAVMICTIISLCGFSFAQASSTKESIYYQLGELEREYISNSTSNVKKEIAIKGNDFTISNVELEYYTKRHELIDSFDTSYSHKTENNSASNYLVERETIYANALKSGITISDLELKEYIQKQVDEFTSVEPDENIQLYLDGLKMTWSEYWNNPTQIEILKRDLVNSKYKDQLREKIAKDEGIEISLSEDYYLSEDCITSDGLDAEEYQEIENVLNGMVEKLVKSEAIKYQTN